MPFYRYDDREKERYKKAGGYFTPNELEPGSQQVFTILRDFGIVAIRCHYNGGNDEGFTYFDEAILPTYTLSLELLKAHLVASPLGERKSPFIAPSFFHKDYTREDFVELRLNWFADELAILLLGGRFGVGEFSIRGSFKADFENGVLLDEYS